MAKKGQPISDQERRSRGIRHLIQFGLKMMNRRDIGGHVPIQEHARVAADKFRGMTATQAGQYHAGEMKKLRDGVASRQSHTIAEIEARFDIVESAFAGVKIAESKQFSDGLPTYPDEMHDLINAVDVLLNGGIIVGKHTTVRGDRKVTVGSHVRKQPTEHILE